MKRALFLLTLLLAACAPATTTPEQVAPQVSIPSTAVAVAPPTLSPTPETADLAGPVVVPTAEPAVPTVVIEQSPTVEAQPSAVAEPTLEVAATTSAIISGRTPEGAFFYGAPDAPLTLIDYSDFL